MQVDPTSQDGVDLLKRVKVSLESKEGAQPDFKRKGSSPAALVPQDGTSVSAQGGNRGPSLPAKPVVKKKSKAASDKDAPALDVGESLQRENAASAAVQGSLKKGPSVDGVSPKLKSVQGQKRFSEQAQEPAKEKNVTSRAMRSLKLIYGHDIRLAEMPVNCG